MLANGMPDWTDDFQSRFQAGIATGFILHFNILDYAAPGLKVKALLLKLLAAREVVAIYNPSEGITFPLASMRQRFGELVGTDQAGQPDPVLASLGIQDGGKQGELPKAPAQALPLLEKLLKSGKGNSAVIIEYPEIIAPAGDISFLTPADRISLVTLSRWPTDPEIDANANPIIMLIENISDLHPDLRKTSRKWDLITVPLPGVEARRNYIESYLAAAEIKTELDSQALANSTAGLSLLAIEDIFLRAMQEGELTLEMVRDLKHQIIADEYGDVLEIIDPELGFEAVGGLEHVKDYLLKSVINPIRDGRKSRVPMGILFTGPAGTGKSIMAEAVGKEAGINVVRLQMGSSIASKWQGEGERNLKKAFAAIEGLAPTVVFIDEIDQTVSRGGNSGNQQEARLFQMLLEFMSNGKHRGEVVFLAATNRPDLMDAALRRPGRFDKKVPFLVPGKEERAAILQVMARKYGLENMQIPAAVIQSTEGWTGAEIEMLTVKAVELVEDEDLSPGSALIAAAERISPSTADIEFMTRIALDETNDLDLLPPEWREKAKAKKHSPAETAEIGRNRGRRQL